MMMAIKRHWLFLLPLVIFAGYYTFQNVLGFIYYPADIVLRFCGALALSAASYVAAYMFLPVEWAGTIPAGRLQPRYIDRLCLLIVVAFTLVMITACFTTDRIPLIEALKGESGAELADDRNGFLRGRTGSGQILNYAYAILSQSLMPFALAYAFWTRASWRWFALSVFTIGVSLTLAKSAFFYAAAPLFALFLMERRWRAAIGTIAALALSIAVMSTVSSGSVGALQSKARGEPVAAKQVEMPADTPAEYNVFGKRHPALLIANRIVWIPYATAIDWFRYQEQRLNGRYVLGQSIRPVAFVMGKERIHLEKAIAEFEWSAESGNTSNAVFFADAWLNWGPLGVIIYSALLALTIKIIATSGYPPLIAASALPVWIAGVSALPPVYFSAGLGLLLLLSFFVRRERALKSQYAFQDACGIVR